MYSPTWPRGFTLRELARRANVSHNAPYRHFRDRDDLMAAVATQGYRELTHTMQRAVEDRTDPLDRLKQAGLAYINFALRRPEHFAVMFDGPVSVRAEDPGSSQAAEEAFTTLVSFVQGCQQAGQFPAGDPQNLTLLAWSTVHGVAKLAITGRLPFRTKAETLKFAGFVIDESLVSQAPTQL